MFNLIEKIKSGSVLEICGEIHQVLAKVKYLTETETVNWYAKIQLENHFVLVIAPYDVGAPYPCEFPAPNTITYNGKTYSKDVEDYQIVKEFVFGDILSMEGEVKYTDYSCDDLIISLGIVLRTQKRADVYARVISLTDVNLIEQ